MSCSKSRYKSKKDKGSILADVKNLLKVLHPALQNMPKIERIEGSPREMKLACYNMIRCFTIAYECPEVRLENIHKIQYGLFTDSEKLNIAIQLERIEEGIKKWRNATRSPKSQEQQEVTDNAELAVSND